jgi:serine acetyltransferase
MDFSQLIYFIHSDICRRLVLEGKPCHIGNALLAVFHRGVFSVILYRVKRYLFLKQNKGLNLIVWLLRFPEFYLCHNEIDPRATIGEGLVLNDYGGVALSYAVIIGKNCTFMGRATPTLGAMEDIDVQDRITIGDYCVVGHNVRMINPISVANGVHIKANSVLISSAKTAGAVLSGFPAKIITTYPMDIMENWNPFSATTIKPISIA